MRGKIDWRLAGYIFGGAFVIWMIVGVILAGNNEPPPPGQQQIRLRGGVVNGHRIHTKSWTFSFNRAYMSPDQLMATVDGVHNGVLYKHGKPYLGIAAEQVSLNTQSLDFSALGDVHVTQLHAKDGVKRSFDTDYVAWSNATKILTLPHPSIVQSGGQTLRVSSITVNFNTDQILFGKMSGGVNVP